MKVLTARAKARKFYFVRRDCLVRVVNQGNKVIVRASRDNFSNQEKAFFIRHLGAEGFIPDEYQRFAKGRSEAVLRVQWCVDQSWINLDPAVRERAFHQVLCTLAAGALVWLISMIPVFLRLG